MENTDSEYFHAQGFVSCSKRVFSGSTIHFHTNFLRPDAQTPIMVLLHGYPQTSFLWRYAHDYLPEGTPLFIPDLPGYGRSSPASRHDKRTIGRSMLEALSQHLSPVSERHRIILVGHDRGARVAHRLAVDLAHSTEAEPYGGFVLAGLVIMDILPTAEQWKVFGETGRNSMRSFHWPLLANVELATEMIGAFGGGGGGKWCREMMRRWSGEDEKGQRSLQGGGAIGVYARYFEEESIIRATCEDYRTGAEEDVIAQDEDQNENRKITVPTLVLYSSDYSGKRYGAQMEEIWSKWMANSDHLQVPKISHSGHFIAEEQPQQTYTALARFYERCQNSAQETSTSQNFPQARREDVDKRHPIARLT